MVHAFEGSEMNDSTYNVEIKVNGGYEFVGRMTVEDIAELLATANRKDKEA